MKKFVVFIALAMFAMTGFSQKIARVAAGTFVHNNEQGVNLEVGATFGKNIVSLVGERFIDDSSAYSVGAKYLRKTSDTDGITGLYGASGTIGLTRDHPIVFKPIVGAAFRETKSFGIVAYVAAPFVEAFERVSFEGGIQAVFRF